MNLLVCYDVSTEEAAGRRRLRRVAQLCRSYGQRVQKSVFECSVNEMQLEELRHKLIELIEAEKDSLRIYRLTQPREMVVETYGRDTYIDYDEPLVV